MDVISGRVAFEQSSNIYPTHNRVWYMSARCCQISKLEGRIDCARCRHWELVRAGRNRTRGAKGGGCQSWEENTPQHFNIGKMELWKLNIQILTVYLSEVLSRGTEYRKISFILSMKWFYHTRTYKRFATQLAVPKKFKYLRRSSQQ